MKLYIDPGTGSMLFAILIGIFGAVGYLLRGLLVKIKFLFTGGKKGEINSNKIPFVIFSDDKRYWMVFKPICEEFEKRGIDVVYMTASKDDPVLDTDYEHIIPQYIGPGNKTFSKLNFLNASIVLSTTPGLDVYQWKRSKDVDYYVHIFHAAADATGYRMFGIDYFDAVLISGDRQREDLLKLEEIRNTPNKEIVKVGIPYMDEMKKRILENSNNSKNETVVLLAPSWGKSGILFKYGERIIEELIDTGYKIIIRPHPQSFISEKEMIDDLTGKYPNSDLLEWNMDSDNFDVLSKTDILISDFSGVIYDFSLVFDKPIIYTDTEFDDGPYDAWWIKEPLWTFSALPRLGKELTKESITNIKNVIDDCINNEKYTKGREEVRNEIWDYRGEASIRVVDFLVDKYKEIGK